MGLKGHKDIIPGEGHWWQVRPKGISSTNQVSAGRCSQVTTFRIRSVSSLDSIRISMITLYLPKNLSFRGPYPSTLPLHPSLSSLYPPFPLIHLHPPHPPLAPHRPLCLPYTSCGPPEERSMEGDIQVSQRAAPQRPAARPTRWCGTHLGDGTDIIRGWRVLAALFSNGWKYLPFRELKYLQYEVKTYSTRK